MIKPHGELSKTQLDYPLVNIQKTMENHHFQWENPLFLYMVIFNSYVKLPEGNYYRGYTSGIMTQHGSLVVNELSIWTSHTARKLFQQQSTVDPMGGRSAGRPHLMKDVSECLVSETPEIISEIHWDFLVPIKNDDTQHQH